MTKEKERIVVTGMGAITPLGLNVEETWINLIAGKSAIKKIEPPVNSQVTIAGVIDNFEPEKYIPEKELSRVHRSAQFSSAATIEALTDAGFFDGSKLINIDPDEIGMVMGSGVGGGSEIAEMESTITKFGDRRISQYSMLRLLLERTATFPSRLLNLRGPVSSKVAACATGSMAITDGMYTIREGDAKVMVVGGTEAVVHRIGVGGFNAMRALSRRGEKPESASRPFDESADGFVMSEGAAALVLESAQHALQRGVRVYAEIAGYDNCSDAYHDTVPSGEGAVRAMRKALAKAGINPEDVDYINTHGTSTVVGDGIELDSLIEVFGDNLKRILVSSTKSSTGHLLGAAGAIEAIFCIKAINEVLVPPTLNLKKPVRENINLIRRVRRRKVRVAMSNSFGFGGINSVLIFRKFS